MRPEKTAGSSYLKLYFEKSPDRQRWVNCAHAFKHRGLPLEFFDELCQSWPYYDRGAVQALWDGITEPRGDYTLGSFYHDAGRTGWENWRKRKLPQHLWERWQTPPKQFEFTTDGLRQWTGGREPRLVRISGLITVLARARGTNANEPSGVLLEFHCDDGRTRETVIRRDQLHEDARELAKHLAHFQFSVTPGKEKDRLVCFVASHKVAVTVPFPAEAVPLPSHGP